MNETQIIVGAELGNVTSLAPTEQESYTLVLAMLDDMTVDVYNKFKKGQDMKLPRVFSNLIATRLSVSQHEKNSKELEDLRNQLNELRELFATTGDY